MPRTAKRLNVGLPLAGGNPRGRYTRQGVLPEPLPGARYAAEVLRDSPVAFWPMQDASGNPIDISGNGNHMTSIAAAADYRVEGPFGHDYGILLEGGETMSRAVVSTVTNNFTMEMWAFVDQVSQGEQVLLHNGNEATNGWGIRLTVQPGCQYRGLAGGIAELNSASFSRGVWQHFVVLRDGGDLDRWKQYLNGFVHSLNSGTTTPATPTGTTLIGKNNLRVAVAYVAIYETALSLDRIRAHFDATGIQRVPYFQ